MVTGEDNPFEPTAASIVSDMLARAVGPDNPMTPEATEAGLEVVQARIDRAREILSGAPITDERPMDTEAMAALVLMQEEQTQTQLAAEERQR